MLEPFTPLSCLKSWLLVPAFVQLCFIDQHVFGASVPGDGVWPVGDEVQTEGVTPDNCYRGQEASAVSSLLWQK